MKIRRLCVICGNNPKDAYFRPGMIPVRITNIDPSRVEYRPCAACNGKGVVTVNTFTR